MKINIYRFDYEMNDKSTWNVYVAAYTNEEAHEVLWSKVGRDIRISTMGHTCRIDVFDEKCIDDIVAANQPKKRGPGRPPKEK